VLAPQGNSLASSRHRTSSDDDGKTAVLSGTPFDLDSTGWPRIMAPKRGNTLKSWSGGRMRSRPSSGANMKGSRKLS
jgi:hypothetical protein